MASKCVRCKNKNGCFDYDTIKDPENCNAFECEDVAIINDFGECSNCHNFVLIKEINYCYHCGMKTQYFNSIS